MTPNMYADFIRHANFTTNERDAMFLSALGLNGEAGEVSEILLEAGLSGEDLSRSTSKIAELIKKHLIHGKDLDRDRLKDELGDVLWYFFLALNTFGLTFAEVAEGNVTKLCARHPSKNGDPEGWIKPESRDLSADPYYHPDPEIHQTRVNAALDRRGVGNL